MLFSVYPTDPPEVRDAVIAAARDHSREHALFTSLHIPESTGLAEYTRQLQAWHERDGLTFCADISPNTLSMLNLTIDQVGVLREWGAACVRIDFGFSVDQIKRIADVGGFRIAVNASTVSAAELDALAGIDVVGWHNYYPRPETGLTSDFVLAQNRLFADRGLDVFVFAPGERTFRAPLHLGLPMLEHQRYRNLWVNYLELTELCPDATIVYAEGVPHARHLSWIEHFERTGEITVPLSEVDTAARFLLDGTWGVRVEQTGVSERLEGTRGVATPPVWVNGDERARGSIQMDLPGYGRYAGETHLMLRDAPLHPHQARVGQIAGAYTGVVDRLRISRRVRFVELDAAGVE